MTIRHVANRSLDNIHGGLCLLENIANRIDMTEQSLQELCGFRHQLSHVADPNQHRKP